MIIAKGKENIALDVEYMLELIRQHPDYNSHGCSNYYDLVHVALADLQDKLFKWEKENNSKKC